MSSFTYLGKIDRWDRYIDKIKQIDKMAYTDVDTDGSSVDDKIFPEIIH